MKAWRNTLLRFGLVTIPVSVTPAKSEKPTVTAHTYDVATGAPVRQAWTTDGETLAAETFRAYDVGGEVVKIDPPTIDGETGIELAAFVAPETIDPLFYDSAYVLFPGKGGAEGLGLVAKMLRDSGRMLAGEARFTDRPRSVVIRWSEAAGSVILHTLTFAARVRFEGMAKASAELAEPTPELLAQAALLTDALPETFIPADTDPLEAAIVKALHVARPSAGASIPTVDTTPDLMAQLRDSVTASAKAKGKAKGKPKRDGIGGMDRAPRGTARK